MELYQMTVSHRGTNDLHHFIFCDYASARRYSNELKKYSTLLNGFTVRRMTLDRKTGSFKKAGVMYHIRFEDAANA